VHHDAACGTRLACPFGCPGYPPFVTGEKLVRRFGVRLICHACGKSEWRTTAASGITAAVITLTRADR
jgi:ribosomal protein L44E